MVNPIKALLAACMLMLACYAGAASAAGERRILLVLSEESGPYIEVAQALRASLDGGGLAKDVQTVPTSALTGMRPISADLLVTVGVKAAEAAAAAAASAPTLNVLIPRESVESLAHTAKLKNTSAIYLDQPLGRQFQLIKAALPARDQVGILLGPTSQDRLRELQSSARENHIKLNIREMSTEEQLLPALRKVLADSEVLLAVPDPLVFNRDTAQSVLLTSYRAQAPMFAFSKSYVTAGALAAVYSTPAQIGQQAGEIIRRYFQTGGGALPPPQYPKYFSVSVNYQVARSLGLALDNEAALLGKIKEHTERE